MVADITYNPVYLLQNNVLGNALRVAVQSANNELITRMDSDDLSATTCFKKEVNCISSDPKLDIVGGVIQNSSVNLPIRRWDGMKW